MIIRDLAAAEAVYDAAHFGRREIDAVSGFCNELYDGGWHLISLKDFAVCRMDRVGCNLHATALAAMLALALAACKDGDQSNGKPAPAGAGKTDIFASPPPALPADAGPADAGPADAGPEASAPDPCAPRDGGAPCPMLRFMKDEIAPAFAAKKSAPVIAALETLAATAPASYPSWASISKDGAAAAKAGEWSAVKASCRGCHAQYKDKYVAEHRAEPLLRKAADGGK